MSSVPSFMDDSGGVLKTHAKSFSWASVFLPQERLQRVRELYHFCRYADNVADELESAEARIALDELRAKVLSPDGHSPEEKMIQGLQQSGVRKEWMLELIQGVESDLSDVKGWSESELFRYCYRVAGVVGLMMCPLIGVKDERAYPFAIDLGIGMQLTNIARDIAEDAGRSRVYLPEAWLRDVQSSSSQLMAREMSRDQIKTVVTRLLDLADTYYASGRMGLNLIPWQPRLAIAVAAGLYQAIGGRVRAQNTPWEGRAYVSVSGKVFLTFKELGVQLWSFLRSSRERPVHEDLLHKDLKGLPGARV